MKRRNGARKSKRPGKRKEDRLQASSIEEEERAAFVAPSTMPLLMLMMVAMVFASILELTPLQNNSSGQNSGPIGRGQENINRNTVKRKQKSLRTARASHRSGE